MEFQGALNGLVALAIAMGVALAPSLPPAPAVEASGGALHCDPWPPLLADPGARDVVFEGVLVGHRYEGEEELAVFLVRRSWKGVRPDTVSVRIVPPYRPPVVSSLGPSSPPPPLGGAYLVLGDRHGSAIVSERCGQFFQLSGAGARLLPLGQPLRTLTLGDVRSLVPRAVIADAAEASVEGPRRPVALTVVGDHGIEWDAEVVLWGRTRRTDERGMARWEGLPEGMHLARVTVDGSEHIFPIVVGCHGGATRCPEVTGRVRLPFIEPGEPVTAVEEAPTFTPHDEGGELLNHAEVIRSVNEVLPDAEFALHLGGRSTDALLEFFFLVGEDGTVRRVHLTKSSARRELDARLVEALHGARFTPARNRGTESVVWIGGRLVTAAPTPGSPPAVSGTDSRMGPETRAQAASPAASPADPSGCQGEACPPQGVLAAVVGFVLEASGMDAEGAALVLDTARFAERVPPHAVRAQLEAVADERGARIGNRDEIIACDELTPENFGTRCSLASGTEALLRLGIPEPTDQGWRVHTVLTRSLGVRDDGTPARPSLVSHDREVFLVRGDGGAWFPRFGGVSGVGHLW